MVQIWDKTQDVFSFHVRMDCDQHECEKNSTMLLAVTGIGVQGVCGGVCVGVCVCVWGGGNSTCIYMFTCMCVSIYF